MDSIAGNNTWILVDLPPEHKPLGNKWIFRKKMKVDGTIDKFKARLVIQGCRQKYGMDYFDTYAPVARISTIRSSSWTFPVEMSTLSTMPAHPVMLEIHIFALSRWRNSVLRFSRDKVNVSRLCTLDVLEPYCVCLLSIEKHSCFDVEMSLLSTLALTLSWINFFLCRGSISTPRFVSDGPKLYESETQ
ncbi:unnamed protein product [Rhodiola kirilowii]